MRLPNARTLRAIRIAHGRHPATGAPLAAAGSPGHGRTCRDCAHHVAIRAGRIYHKCRRAGVSAGPATDISPRWPACAYWAPDPGVDTPARIGL